MVKCSGQGGGFVSCSPKYIIKKDCCCCWVAARMLCVNPCWIIHQAWGEFTYSCISIAVIGLISAAFPAGLKRLEKYLVAKIYLLSNKHVFWNYKHFLTICSTFWWKQLSKYILHQPFWEIAKPVYYCIHCKREILYVLYTRLNQIVSFQFFFKFRYRRSQAVGLRRPNIIVSTFTQQPLKMATVIWGECCISGNRSF